MGTVSWEWEIVLIHSLFAIGLMLELRCINKSIKASKWNKIRGVVLKCSTERTTPSTFSYKSNVEYIYRVDNEEIKSQKVAFSTSDTCLALLKGLYICVGETEIYYNPVNPKESVLITGVRIFHIITIMFIFGLSYLSFKIL